MEILKGVEIERELLERLVVSGQLGHEVALAHNNDPGSNAFTFGNDRYHRSCETSKLALEECGFHVRRSGAALYGIRNGVEIHFATARTADVHTPSSFDPNTDARIAAGLNNATVQQPFEGIDELLPPRRQILHVVWSGNDAIGLVATHIGRLVTFSETHVVWDEVSRIDRIDARRTNAEETSLDPVTYADQIEPSLDLTAVPVTIEHADAEQK